MILKFLEQKTSKTPWALVAIRSSNGMSIRCSSVMILFIKELQKPQYLRGLEEQHCLSRERAQISEAMGIIYQYYVCQLADDQKKDLPLVDYNQFLMKEQVDLLEAESNLNFSIQQSLQQFHSTLISKINIQQRSSYFEKYQKRQKQGPQKMFYHRESLLSRMFELQDFKTLYNMVAASFIVLTISLIYDEYKNEGQILDFFVLSEIFNGKATIIKTWLMMAINLFTIVPIMKMAIRASAILWVPVYCLHLSLFFIIGSHYSRHHSLGFGSVMVIMCECVRMFMKSHAYFRTKMLYLTNNDYKHFQVRGVRAERIEGSEKKTQDQCSQKKVHRILIENGSFEEQISKLTYYFICPTLIYRDQYAKIPKRSASKIIFNLLNFLACIYYTFILYKKWCKPSIQNLANKLDIQELTNATVNLMLPSVCFLILGFFGFLHSWVNLWAEITRFPDRLFYADWWNVTEFSTYYRKWNIIVHDWLYYYVYLDLSRFFNLSKSKRIIPLMTTFAISAVIHEIIIYYAIGFFYPILFIIFVGPGVIILQSSTFKRISDNLLFWLLMYLGTTLIFTLLLAEAFARNKISDAFIQKQWGNLSFLIPRTLYLGS